MTDRLNALTVVLERDIRDDDAAPLIAAIRQLRGVASVTPTVANFDDYLAYTRARFDLTKRLWKALEDSE